MLDAIRNRKDREQGFTLIELMVVVLIIAILVAIAVPTFLGARERAQDKAANSDLRNALVAGKVLYTDNETYVQTAAELEAVEPNLDFDDDVANSDEDTIGIVDAATQILFVRRSEAGDYFAVFENETTGTDSCSAAALASLNTVALCDALNNPWTD